MQVVGQRVIVEVSKKYDDKVKYKSLELAIDPAFNPTWNLRYFGNVISTPTVDCYYEEGVMCRPEIMVGDIAYFRYIYNDHDGYAIESYEDKAGVEAKLLCIPYSDIIAVVRDGKTIAVNGWILASPLIEGGGEELEIVGESGVKSKVKVEFFEGTNIIKSVNEKDSKNMAVVKHVSTFHGQESALKPNDIAYSKHINAISFLNEINGEKYYCFREDTVDGIYLT